MSTEKSLSYLNKSQDELEPLLTYLRRLIIEARDRALTTVDVIQVQTYWQVGRHLVELEQNRPSRAEHGERLAPVVPEQLIAEIC